MKNSFQTLSTFTVGDRTFSIHRLDALERRGWNVSRLPYSLRILLENLLRREDGFAVTAEQVEALARWEPGAKAPAEIAFTPARVLLQDFTGVPAVVDLAAMRGAIGRMGGDPGKINPLFPAELVIDHSVQVDAYGSTTAFAVNAEREFERNRERYAFLKWGQLAFDNFKVVPPDTGIVHQVNLEYLASVVMTAKRGPGIDGPALAYPDTVVGTDSHTTMINGLGVLGWGVGGIEAEAAMLGQPMSMLIPEVVGVRLTGSLAEGATATDAVLTVTEMLRKKGVVGKFVEFFGPGLDGLPLADRATIANMAPEYGATCGIFPVDAATLAYLELTGRSPDQIALVESYMKEQGLFQGPGARESAVYSETVELDLGSVETSLAGPRRPQDRVRIGEVKRAFLDALVSLQPAARAAASAGLPQRVVPSVPGSASAPGPMVSVSGAHPGSTGRPAESAVNIISGRPAPGATPSTERWVGEGGAPAMKNPGEPGAAPLGGGPVPLGGDPLAAAPAAAFTTKSAPAGGAAAGPAAGAGASPREGPREGPGERPGERPGEGAARASGSASTAVDGRASSSAVPVTMAGETFTLDHGSIVIAAITSCTNTSNPSVMLGAGILARKAVERGLRSRPWVKTSLAPGSKAVTDYLLGAGLAPYLDQLGFNLVGYGCTTCIGNSGPLPPAVSAAIEGAGLVAVSVLSGNRNFEGRINPEVRANYLASPPLVVAYALAGRIDMDLTTEPLGLGHGGQPVFLRDIWPTQEEVTSAVRSAVRSEMFRRSYADVFAGDERWRALGAAGGDTYTWDPASTYVKEPPYFVDMPADPPSPTEIEGARVLALFGDSITTDHISPAGSIKPSSPAGLYLQARGVPPAEFNSYGSRRGNHEVMMRGTFANVRLRNMLVPGVEGGETIHLPEGTRTSIFDAAMKYKDEGTPLIVLAGKEYGSGSSRDWAAKGPCLLGVRAVIAESYERIHRSNLVGMGIAPLQFHAGESAAWLGLTGREVFDIEGLAQGVETGFRAGHDVVVRARREDGTLAEFRATARLDTPQEVLYFRHGGILQYVLRQLLRSRTPA